MKILFLSFYFEPDLCAGSFRNTSLFKELLNHIGKKDFIHVITTYPNRYHSFKVKSLEEEIGVNYKINRVRIPIHKSGFIDQAKSFCFYYRKVLWLINNEKYDMVFASSSRLFTAFLARKISAKQKIPLYLDIRDIFVDTISDIFKDKIFIRLPIVFCFKLIEKYTFANASHINLVSEGFKTYFSVYPKPNYSYFTNGIDNIFLEKDEGVLGCPFEMKDVKIITYAGNIGSGQGLEKIIPEAAEIFGDRYLFRIIGDGSTKSLLEDSVKKKRLTNVELILPVPRDKLIQYYMETDFFFLHLNDLVAFKKVLPSKLFEYGAYDKPIIAGVSGYAAIFIREKLGNTLLFQPTDVNNFILEMNHYVYKLVDRVQFKKEYSRNKILEMMAQSIISYLE